MFLNSEQILGHLQEGTLVIDPPPDDTSISRCAVDIRLGTSFASFRPLPEPDTLLDPSSITASDLWHNVTLDLGQAFRLDPRSAVLAVTLESVGCPPDLAAFLFPRSDFGRIGVIFQSVIVEPYFQGKLVMLIHNIGSVSVALNTGMKFAKLLFSEVRPATTKSLSAIAQEDLRAEIEPLQQTLEDRAKRLVTEKEPRPSIRELLSQAMEAEKNVKGKALETVMVTIFQTIKDLTILSVNARLRAEELDIVLKNDVNIGFWKFIGSPILVECKNWSGKVGAREVTILYDNLVSLGPDAKTGILVAPNGLTGNAYRDAMLKIREKRQLGRYIILLDKQDLEHIADGTHASLVIERKYDELFLI